MTKNKLKILMCSEASFVNSGFGIYNKELLSRLYNTNKYDIAEFASYGFVNDPRDKTIPWKYYANAVKDDDPRHQQYSSRPDNQFGRWRFEKVLLDFKPDVVIDVRDYWMSYYQGLSPLRKFFHWILMPTVDSAPQQEDWIDTYISADAVFTYSDWGADVIKEQSSNKINYINTTSPGVDLNVFNIKENKAQIKDALGLPPDSIVIGSVMRNQKRKLIPELFLSMRKLIDRLEKENNKLGENLIFYMHTSYPDAGWDIPELLKNHRMANRVYFSYVCSSCGAVEASTFSHPVKVCSSCGNKNSRLPSVTNGVTSETLANIYNTFDLYVQYAICEGFGMPQVEAGACGVPIATVDYSAMCDVVSKLEAYPIRVGSFFKELETKASRAYPDNDHLVDIIYKHISLPEPILNQKRIRTRELTEKYYNWDDIAAKWVNYLDGLDEKGYRSNWSRETHYLPEIPKDLKTDNNTVITAIKMCANNLNDIDFASSMNMLSMLNDADYGFTQSGPSYNGYDFNNTIDNIKKMIDNNNQSEHARASNMVFDDDFIRYAHLKEQLK
jgi:glycosyltransferase involved in cell wall biosynthesis